MAREDLTVQTVSMDGLNPSYTSAIADGHRFDNSERRIVAYVKNDDASEHTVTFVTSRQIRGLDVADQTVDVPAGEERAVGTFPAGAFQDSVDVDYDDVTSMSIAIIEVP